VSLGELLAWVQGDLDAETFFDGCRVEYELVDAATAGVSLSAAERARVGSCPDCAFAFALVARNEQVVTRGGWDSGDDTSVPVPGCGVTGAVFGLDFGAPTTRQFYGFVEDYDYNGTPVDMWMRHAGADWVPVDDASFDAVAGTFAYREMVTYSLFAY